MVLVDGQNEIVKFVLNRPCIDAEVACRCYILHIYDVELCFFLFWVALISFKPNPCSKTSWTSSDVKPAVSGKQNKQKIHPRRHNPAQNPKAPAGVKRSMSERYVAPMRRFAAQFVVVQREDPIPLTSSEKDSPSCQGSLPSPVA